MTNGGIIEGNTEYSGFSDLNLATSFAGQHDNIATITYTMARKGGIVRRVAGSGDTQGLCASAELQSASHCVRNPLNLHVEKEARLRSQHFTLGVDVKQKQQTSWGAQAVLGRPLP